jgi:hypothetical protein
MLEIRKQSNYDHDLLVHSSEIEASVQLLWRIIYTLFASSRAHGYIFHA